MKKLIVIALVLVTIQVNAQDRKREHREGERKERMHRMSDLSPEEAATLKTKKMTLHLDLTESQQNEILKLNLERAKAKKAMMEKRKEKRENAEKEKPSKEERLKMKNEMLDEQIATKKKIKQILNEEQYKKWERSLQRQKGERGPQEKRMMKERKRR